jgi:2'-5' RNA ligase
MTERVLVIFPRFLNPTPIHRLRSRFDPLSGEMDPHITLVFPFRSELTPHELQEHLSSVVADIEPFPVLLRGVTGYEWEYLFLNVKQGNDALIDLHDRLYTGPLRPYLQPAHTFLPHLTVGRLRDPTAFHNALRIASEVEEAFETVVHEVVSYTLATSGERGVELTVPLGMVIPTLTMPISVGK